MQEYLNSGLRLGGLVNPQEQQVEIYRAERLVEIVNLPATLDSETVLLDFTLLIARF